MKKQSSTAAAQVTWRAFTLVEMLISIVVLALLILIVTQVVNTTAAVVRPANKHIDTDTQGRAILDRMALDFGKMLKRTDVDYVIKQPGRANYPGNSGGHSQGQGKKASSGQELNDWMAFFSQMPGYYPSGAQSPISLVAYRVNGNPNSASYLMLERMGKGLLWNGASNSTNPSAIYPIVFLPGQIAPVGGGATTGPWAGPWYAAVN